MNIKTVVGTFFVAAIAAAQSVAMAGVIFVGSWQVDQGPGWTSEPPAYTGQEAAAHLFGGTASDYYISTVGDDVLTIDHLAWYSLIGVEFGHKLAEDYSSKLPGGLYYDGLFDYSNHLGDLSNPASAYIYDNALGSQYTNYAFRITDDNGTDVPAPASLILLGSALFGLGLARRRRA